MSRYLLSTIFAVASTALTVSQTYAASQFPMGAYLQNSGLPDSNDRTLFDNHYQQFTNAMGAAPQFLDTYIDDRQPQSSWVQNAGWLAYCLQTDSYANAMTQVIGIPLFSTANGIGQYPDPQLQDMAGGAYDDAIRGMVDQLTTSRTPGFEGFKTIYFRLGWEMNLPGTWFAGQDQQTIADWVLAFQHVAVVLRQQAAANNATALIVWNPGTVVWGVQNVTQVFYPGDSYVDVIAVDMYADMYPVTNGTDPVTWENWDRANSPTGQPWADPDYLDVIRDSVSRWHYWSFPSADEWAPFGDVNGNSTSFLGIMHFAQNRGKPFGVAEAGAGGAVPFNDVFDDGAFPNWLGNHLAYAQAQGLTIAFVNLWDNDSPSPYMFTDGTKPNELAGFRAWFGSN